MQIPGYRALQRIDSLIGYPLLLILKIPVIVLGLTLKRSHDAAPQGDITFIKMLGGGSLVIALPTLLGIKEKYPNISLNLICSDAVAPFAKALHVFDNIYVIHMRSLSSLVFSTLKTILLNFKKTDTIVNLEIYSKLSTILALLTLARNRVEFYSNNVFFRRRIATHLIYFNRSAPIWKFYEQAALIMSAQASSSEKASEHLKNLYSSSQENETNRIAIAPGCSPLCPERQLSASQWANVICSEASTINSEHEILFLGGPGDNAIAAQIQELTRQRGATLSSQNLCGRYSLEKSLHSLVGCTEFYGIDSGLLHFARFLGLRVNAFFGPTDPATLLQPIQNLNEQIIYTPPLCSPCVHNAESAPCRGNNICIKQAVTGKNTLYQDRLTILYPDS